MATGLHLPSWDREPAGTRERPFPASVEEFHTAIDAMSDSVFVVAALRGPDGEPVDLEYRFVNDAALRLYQRSRKDVVGHTFFELFPGLRDSEMWAMFCEVMATGTSGGLYLPEFDEEGIRGSFQLTAARLPDGLIVVAHDVTDRVRMEKQLRRERDFVEATLDVARALIVVVDADFVIVRFNHFCEELTGYREDEVVGHHISMLLPPDEGTWIVGNVEPIRPEEAVSQTNHWVTKDGGRRRIRWTNAALTDDRGNLAHVISIGVDITEQQRAEEQLAQRAQELEAANRELARSNEDLEQFAYLASHDLSEPLRAISGPITFVAQNYTDQPLDDRAQEFLGFAIEGCSRMRAMIDGLLAYSRVGRLEAATTSVDSGGIVADVLASLAPLIAKANAVVAVDDPLPVVRAEANQLAMVFQNLISNAVKFVPDGLTPQVSIEAERDGSRWRFSVTDNGIGVAPQHRERAFAMFKRLQARDDYPGTGIGLAIVKKIVERHGGQVGIEEAPVGTGSRFWFTLPATEEARP